MAKFTDDSHTLLSEDPRYKWTWMVHEYATGKFFARIPSVSLPVLRLHSRMILNDVEYEIVGIGYTTRVLVVRPVKEAEK